MNEPYSICVYLPRKLFVLVFIFENLGGLLVIEVVAEVSAKDLFSWLSYNKLGVDGEICDFLKGEELSFVIVV